MFVLKARDVVFRTLCLPHGMRAVCCATWSFSAKPSNAQVGKMLENGTPRGRVVKQFKISECGDCVIIRISILGEVIKSFHPDDCCVAK